MGEAKGFPFATFVRVREIHTDSAKFALGRFTQKGQAYIEKHV